MEISNYIELIEREFQNRRKDRPGHSLRAFAKDLGISPQSLSLILKGKQRVSLFMAGKLSRRLNFTALETEFFLLLVEKSKKLSPEKEIEVGLKLDRVLSLMNQREEAPTDFDPISDWEYTAIMVLTDLQDFHDDPDWIAEQLSITPERAKKCLQSLVDGNYLALENGKLVRGATCQIFKIDRTSLAYQNHYRQILEKAQQSISIPDVKVREFANLMISIGEEDYDFVVNKMEKFRRELLTELNERHAPTDRVYSLAMQMFPLSKISQPHQTKAKMDV